MEKGEKISYTVTTGKGEQTKNALLNENDSLWVKYRHEHIANVMEHQATLMEQLMKGGGAVAFTERVGEPARQGALARVRGAEHEDHAREVIEGKALPGLWDDGLGHASS